MKVAPVWVLVLSRMAELMLEPVMSVRWRIQDIRRASWVSRDRDAALPWRALMWLTRAIETAHLAAGRPVWNARLQRWEAEQLRQPAEGVWPLNMAALRDALTRVV